VSYVEVFFAYSRQDEDLRNELEKHLSHLRRQGWISTWHDRQISAGTEWRSEIDKHLNSAHLILLLISADFVASDYCYSVEMTKAMERHESGEAQVIPVILRPVDWEGLPFSKLQALPQNSMPVTLWADRDAAFVSIARGVREAVQELRRMLIPSEVGVDYSNLQELLAEGQSGQPANTTSAKSSVETDDLSSEVGVDYSRLQELLAEGKWREADKETADKMLAAMSQESWWDVVEIEDKKFPCTDLRTIDRLWVKYSNGRFGFSVQKRIWESLGGKPGEYDDEIYTKFCDRVGWRVKGNWKSDKELTWDIDAPEGHLPYVFVWGVDVWVWVYLMGYVISGLGVVLFGVSGGDLYRGTPFIDDFVKVFEVVTSEWGWVFLLGCFMICVADWGVKETTERHRKEKDRFLFSRIRACKL
jgi:hypothetical protein